MYLAGSVYGKPYSVWLSKQHVNLSDRYKNHKLLSQLSADLMGLKGPFPCKIQQVARKLLLMAITIITLHAISFFKTVTPLYYSLYLALLFGS